MLGSHAPLGLDSRKDLGYGRNKNSRQNLRQAPGCYPYDCAVRDSNVDIDDETFLAVQSKKINKKSRDFYAKKGTNPFYFAAGNSILECFENPNSMLENIAALGDSMSPLPIKRNRMSGGMTSASKKYWHGAETEFRPGFKAGWFSPPPESELYYDPSNDPYDEAVFDMDNLLNKVKKIRGM